MKRKNDLPELLAPAGSFECLLAATEAGADAVYVGGKRFGARAFAKNFDQEELKTAVNYCHLHGVKLYVTLNVLIEERELAEAVSYARELYRIGVDALIIADLGALSEIRAALPDFELHASTQMSVHNSEGALAAHSLGCSRVVPARELSLSDIKTMVDSTPTEVEVFLHGALCVCHSGQCLFSSMVGGRSGNRGECAQPCRLPYNGGYPLSLKDLSLASHIPELIESGVASLKIEGRMKSADFVYTVTSVYRRLLDERRSATPSELDLLRRAFSRGGFTDGYFTGRLASGMVGTRSERDKQESREASGRVFLPKKKAVAMRASFLRGKPCSLTVSADEREATAYGDIPVEAQNAPLNEADLRARLSKLGNTLLTVKAEDIEIELDEGLNLSPSAINALRRKAASLYESSEREAGAEDSYLAEAARDIGKEGAWGITGVPYPVTAQFCSASCFEELTDLDPDITDALDVSFLPTGSPAELYEKAKGVYIPPVVKDSEKGAVLEGLKIAKKHGAMYALVGNIGHIAYAKQAELIPVGDFRLNVTNSSSVRAYNALGVTHVILSPELTAPKARGISGAVTVYGRIPLMITERCFIKESFGCNNCSRASFTDRRGERFPVIREAGHRNLILNSQITYMGDKREELDKNRLRSHHFIFTVENGREAATALRAYRSRAALGAKVRRMGRRDPS